MEDTKIGQIINSVFKFSNPFEKTVIGSPNILHREVKKIANAIKHRKYNTLELTYHKEPGCNIEYSFGSPGIK